MRKVAMLAVVALLGFGLTGCSYSPERVDSSERVDSPERVVDDMMEAIRDLNAELSRIETTEDLNAAEDRIKRLARGIKSITKRFVRLGMDDLPEEKLEALWQRYGTEMPETSQELMVNIIRLRLLAMTDPEAAKALGPLQGLFDID